MVIFPPDPLMTPPMTLNPTQDQDHEGEEHSQAVCNVESQHNKTRVNNRVTFSDKRD